MIGNINGGAGAQVKAELGISLETKVVAFIYGGQPAGDWNLRAESLPPDWVCVVCAGGKLPGGKPLPANYLLASADAYIPDLVSMPLTMPLKISHEAASCMPESE